MISLAKLKVGDLAPDIEAHTFNMGNFRLSELKGKERVYVVFSRYFGCTMCQLDFKELMERVDDILKHGKMVYVTQSGPENAEKFLAGKTVPFPIVLDSKEPYPLYEAYGIGNLTPSDTPRVMARATKARAEGFQHGAYEGNERQSPADFIISKEGTIEYAHYGPLDLEKSMKLWFREQGDT